jgi:dihydrofolate reductase
MSELPKVVFSGTLREPLAWTNSRLAEADILDEVRALKVQTGHPLRTIGSLSVVKGLLGAGMVDRLRLTVFPQILGITGRESVFSGLPDIDLELIDTNVLDVRLVTLEIAPLPPTRRTKRSFQNSPSNPYSKRTGSDGHAEPRLRYEALCGEVLAPKHGR